MTAKKDGGIPVIMYHGIIYEEGNDLRVPESSFYEQMNYLKENNYTTLTLDELYNFLIKGDSFPSKSVVITFDDGFRNNYDNAYPILKSLGFKATIFITTCEIDKKVNYLSSPQLKEMELNGINIQSHTVYHEDLSRLNYYSQLKTLKESKMFIENILNKEVKYLAYPYGTWNKQTFKAVKAAGYVMAFAKDNGWTYLRNGIYTLDRIYVRGSYSLDQFKALLLPT